MDYTLIEQFNLFWNLFQVDETKYPRRRACSIKLWVDMPAERRDAILDDLRRNGKPEQGNPFFFLQEFGTVRAPQILSYREYYARFHTTEEQGGWRMVKPENGNVYYEHG